MSQKVSGIKLTRFRLIGPQSMKEDAEYFPHCTKLESDGKHLWILSERGERNYSREMADVREIAFAEMFYEGLGTRKSSRETISL